MQKQPPDRNNPANPLIKVASLDIERYSKAKEERIVIQANFKRSENIQGTTTDREGTELTVTFAMSLRRATLQLTFERDNGASAAGLISVRKVSFERPLTTITKTNETIENSAFSRRNVSLSARMKAATTRMMSGAAPDAELGLGGSVAKTRASTRRDKRTTSYLTANVTATHAGNQVMWDIRPRIESGDASFIEGNLFMAKNGRLQAACHLLRKGQTTSSDIAICASTFVTMADMHVGLINIMDRLGTDRHYSDAHEYATNPFALNVSKKKERLLKELIRKHLTSQGMRTEGSLVEISRAGA